MDSFLNIPVKKLKNSMNFFRELGFEFNEQFTDEKAACMIVNEHSYVMLLEEKFFKTFTKKEISDTNRFTEMIFAISVDSKEKVVETVNKALSLGGKPSEPLYDMGWMFGWSFQDLDGHLWEVLHMDME